MRFVYSLSIIIRADSLNSVAELKQNYPVSHACDGCLATRLLYGLNTSNLLVALSVPITLKTTFHNSFDTALNGRRF